MQFCPLCRTRMIRTRRSSLTLKCPKCGYKISVHKKADLDRTKPPNAPTGKIAVLGRRELELYTFPTVRETCQACGRKKAETWTVSTGSEGASSITFFRCTFCGYTWREKG